MKTPKRHYDTNLNHLNHALFIGKDKELRTRWKRKNRIRQLKHTIKVLTAALRDTENCLTWTQWQTKCFLVYPDHWQPRLKQIRKELDS
jgi:hypothetical protein